MLGQQSLFFAKNVWTSYIVNPVMALFGPLIDSIKFILDNWDLVMLGMKMAYQRYLKPVFDAISFVAEMALKPLKITWDAISDAFTWAYDNVISPIFTMMQNAIDALMDKLQPVLDGLEKAKNAFSGVVDKGKGMFKSVAGKLGFSEGGIASGPLVDIPPHFMAQRQLFHYQVVVPFLLKLTAVAVVEVIPSTSASMRQA